MDQILILLLLFCVGVPALAATLMGTVGALFAPRGPAAPIAASPEPVAPRPPATTGMLFALLDRPAPAAPPAAAPPPALAPYRVPGG